MWQTILNNMYVTICIFVCLRLCMQSFICQEMKQKMPQSGEGSMQGPPKVVFYLRSSASVGCLPTKVVFHRESSSFFSRLPPKVVFQQRCPPPTVVFHQRLSSTYHATLVDLIFVRAVNTPKLRSGLNFF